MKDLEITKLCAEAISLEYEGEIIFLYDPLRDDAQAMALVKNLYLHVGYQIQSSKGEVNNCAWVATSRTGVQGFGMNDLNRAICECVAKMHEAKK